MTDTQTTTPLPILLSINLILTTGDDGMIHATLVRWHSDGRRMVIPLDILSIGAAWEAITVLPECNVGIA
jgi:hypothetical protein